VHEGGFTLHPAVWQGAIASNPNYSDAPDLTSRSMAAAIKARV